MKQGRRRPRKQYLVRWKSSWVDRSPYRAGVDGKLEEEEESIKNAGVELMAPLDQLPSHFILAYTDQGCFTRSGSGRNILFH